MSAPDPTSPAGMSTVELAVELENEHGVARHYVTKMSKAQRIKAVIEARLAQDEAIEFVADMNFNEVAVPSYDMFDSTPMSGEAAMDYFDPDLFMAELASTRDEHEAEVRAASLLVPSPDTYDYSFNGHAGAGPSASERWMSCTSSLQASREFLETLTPNQQAIFANSNEAARQGTTAHAAAEVEARVMLGEMDQAEADLTLLELAAMPDSDGEAYDEEMGDYITEYTDLVKSYAQDRGNDHVLIEQRVIASVPLTGDHEGEVYEIPGSADAIALPVIGSPDPEHRTLVVSDLKYGNGIWVGVDENSQARIYALGALGLLADDEGNLITDVDTVVLHIIQPRMDGIKTWSESVSSLLTWRDEVLAPALTAALYGAQAGATFNPSEGACQFCPARGGCPALAEARVTAAADLFDTQVEAEFADGPGSFPETSLLTDTRLGELLAQVSGLIDIHKDLKAEAERRLYRGDSVPGFGLVNYQPKREWKPGAEEALDEVPELWTKKIVSPTQAEKIMKASPEEWDTESIEAWVNKPDKRPVVAKDGDRRSKWEGRPPEAMFDIEPESGEQ